MAVSRIAPASDCPATSQNSATSSAPERTFNQVLATQLPAACDDARDNRRQELKQAVQVNELPRGRDSQEVLAVGNASAAVGGTRAAVDGNVTPQENKWTPTSDAQIKSLIANALNRNKGDISKAFAYLRDLRQQPENYYNSNLAIAADYLRARWETQRCGPEVAIAEVEIYMKLKKDGEAPKEGPGPVSPYSPLELQFMKAGVRDQADKMSLLEQLWWASQPGLEFGTAMATWGVLPHNKG
jgi:hypothetical protein